MKIQHYYLKSRLFIFFIMYMINSEILKIPNKINSKIRSYRLKKLNFIAFDIEHSNI